MKAIMCRALGSPDTLTYETDLPDPESGEGEVVIEVASAGVNFPDTLVIQGLYQFRPDLPFSPGGEVAGTIKSVGPGVSGWAVGDRVAYMCLTGGFRDQIVASAAGLMRVPNTLPLTTAGGFIITYGTSMHALTQRAQLKAGESLLVLGAGGGVGLAAVEIGKAMGARVIAAASSAEKLAAAKAAGADDLINYSEQDLREALKALVGKRGVDVVYDPVGGSNFEAALRSTAWGGRALVVGFASGDIPKVPANLPLLKGCSVVGVFWGEHRLRDVATDNANFDQLFAWHAEGKINPLISHEMPLNEAAEALTLLQDRKALGKIILIP